MPITRKRTLIACGLVLAVLLVGVGPVAAQSGGNATTTAAPSGGSGDVVQIDEETDLLGSSYDADTETATVTLRSDTKQLVTLVDGGAFRQGGVVPRRQVVLDPGERRTVEMAVTEVDGWVGVSITTSSGTLYSEVIEGESAGLGGLSPDAPSDIMALFIGATIGPTSVYGISRLHDRRRDNGVEHVG